MYEVYMANRTLWPSFYEIHAQKFLRRNLRN